MYRASTSQGPVFAILISHMSGKKYRQFSVYTRISWQIAIETAEEQ